MPWATLVANILGAALLGVVVTRFATEERWRHFAGTGFCGALTTFSTLQIELIQLAKLGRAWTAIGYLVISVLAGLVAFHLAARLARYSPAPVSA